MDAFFFKQIAYSLHLKIGSGNTLINKGFGVRFCTEFCRFIVQICLVTVNSVHVLLLHMGTSTQVKILLNSEIILCEST